MQREFVDNMTLIEMQRSLRRRGLHLIRCIPKQINQVSEDGRRMSEGYVIFYVPERYTR
jgi:hypothetical protein